MAETLLDSVPVTDWRIAPTVDAGRCARLLKDAPPPNRLIVDLSATALGEAHAKALDLRWVQACDSQGYFRLELAFRVSAELFDWFFNGRTGYRAAYWLSTQHGMLFNAVALRALLPAIKSAWENGPLMEKDWEPLYASLMGQDSKIWVANDSRHFCPDSQGDLVPARWKERGGVGTCLPLPQMPRVEIKGTFFDRNGNRWLSDLKADRHEHLHQSGFA
jgi:hypothetical protein